MSDKIKEKDLETCVSCGTVFDSMNQGCYMSDEYISEIIPRGEKTTRRKYCLNKFFCCDTCEEAYIARKKTKKFLNDKRISISLKIEEFDDLFAVKLIGEEGSYNRPFITAIKDTIESKTALDCIEISLSYDCIDSSAFREGESRETIIKALQELQKTLLPKDLCLKNWQDERTPFTTSSWIIYKHGTDFKELYNFYNPETRVITITKFEDGE